MKFRYRFLIAISFLLLFLSTCYAENDIKGVSLDSTTIRVHLTRLKLFDQCKVVSDGNLFLSRNGRLDGVIPEQTEILLAILDNDICMYTDSFRMNCGSKIELTPENNNIGIRINGSACIYYGSLSLYISEGKLIPVLHMNIEDYTMGVVPNEMGDAFPLEALKAQAVAARTYALGAVDPSKPYDVVDTTNDQVFRGYTNEHPISDKAVEETEGIIGWYKGKPAQCYYSASNGGWTELPEKVWPQKKGLKYYANVYDPYDIANPASPVLSLVIDGLTGQDKLNTLILDNLPQKYKNSDIMIETITSISTVSSNKDHFQDKLKIECLILKAKEIASSDDEEVSLTLSSLPEISDTNYIRENVSLTLPIFPTAENALQLDISPNFQNEIWSVLNDKDEFTIEVRRYGHGVGMSQRGAQWMAQNENMDFIKILSFYYPGMELVHVYEKTQKTNLVSDTLLTTPGPAATATPRPSPAPITINPEAGQWMARVSGIAEDSTLNLRAAPSFQAGVITRLVFGQQVIVLESCENGWVKVSTGSTEGFVVSSYLAGVIE